MTQSFPTSSQLDRLAVCASSVDISEPLKDREKILPGQKLRSEMSPSEVGTLIHLAISNAVELYNGRFDKDTVSLILKLASNYDVFDDVRDINFNEIIVRYGGGHWRTELSFAVGYDNNDHDVCAIGTYRLPNGVNQTYAGQADAIIYFPSSTTALDWKTGYGYSPDITENRQLSSAALAIKLDPNRPNTGPIEKAIFYTRENKLVTSIFNEKEEWPYGAIPEYGSLTAGSHCRYCNRKPDCSAFFEHSERLVSGIVC